MARAAAAWLRTARGLSRAALPFLAGLLVACGGSGGGSSTTSDPGAGGAGSGAFSIEMPLAAEDAGTAGNRLWPFGVHGADHGADGHPGWDIEYLPGRSVLAAAAGVVQSVQPDGSLPGSFTVQLDHRRATGGYRTVYGHLGPLEPGIVPGASVGVGQRLGQATVQTRMIGGQSVTYATIHFQTDDFSKNDGITNPNAVGPDTLLSPTGKAVFEALWPGAHYLQELVEPFPSNPRNVGFPLSRSWTLVAGAGAARIDVRAPSAQTSTFDYTVFDAAGVVTETGTLTLAHDASPSQVDFLPRGSPTARLGVYAVVSGSWRLALGGAGMARPASLTAASEYATH